MESSIELIGPIVWFLTAISYSFAWATAGSFFYHIGSDSDRTDETFGFYCGFGGLLWPVAFPVIVSAYFGDRLGRKIVDHFSSRGQHASKKQISSL